ncbi:MAG: phosphoribosyltransferase [Alphaproteobacteria bacterium]|nr:phosphoribosyltransferase [Alphaproteobacteria bacterium]
MPFADRRDAGRRLAAALARFKDRRPTVLALPRGGVPVGFEIAMRLHAPLDVVLVRKIGHPWSPELAIGALAEGEPPVRFTDDDMVTELGVSRAYLDEEIARQTREIDRRKQLYFAAGSRPGVRDRTAIVVDDGIATGATMRAALRAVHKRRPAKLVLAVPVAPSSTLDSLRAEADEIVCLESPDDFAAIGQFYADFRPVEDETVIEILRQATAIPPTDRARER